VPYNINIDSKIRELLSGRRNIESRKMFGGVCYLLRGNMFSGLYKDFLILRLGDKGAQEALRSKYVKPFDITGKPMKGWVMVDEKGFRSDDELSAWLEEALDFVKTLPEKK